MKADHRFYWDAIFNNIKRVCFFAFLPILIARLGASNFVIAASNSVPEFFAALSLAFVTRHLPVTRNVFLVAGYTRQIAFLCMALSVLLPNPLPYMLFFWGINAFSVMVTATQQPAIMRRNIEQNTLLRVIDNTKLIGVIILTAGSFVVGSTLDATQSWFPRNYVAFMLVGCLATFVGMTLIAKLAPRDNIRLAFRPSLPLRECNRSMWWMALNSLGIAMEIPLFVIYHVKVLTFNNMQIGFFLAASGAFSVLGLPLTRSLRKHLGETKMYGLSVIVMAGVFMPYGLIQSFWFLLVLQALNGVAVAVYDVTQQGLMIYDATNHTHEMGYFSDFQLIMHFSLAVGPPLAASLLEVLPLWSCFAIIALLRMFFFLSKPRVMPSLHYRP